MRLLIDNVTIPLGATAITSELQHGARGQGWRLWEGILRCVANQGNVTITLRCAVTGETIEAVSITGGANKSSGVFKIPQIYDVTATTTSGAVDAVVSIYLDGDTGRSPDEVTIS